MSIRLRRSALLAAILISISQFPASFAQDTNTLLGAERAAIFSSQSNQFLSGPSRAPVRMMNTFLADQGFNAGTIGSLVSEGDGFTGPQGWTHMRFTQQFDGLRVHGAYVRAAFASDGSLYHLIERIVPVGNLRSSVPLISEDEALLSALDATFPGFGAIPGRRGSTGNFTNFAGGSFFYSDPWVERVIIVNRGIGSVGFLVETWGNDDNQLYHTLVGGNGQVLDVELRTANDSYNIFPDQPVVDGISGGSAQAVVSGPGSGNTESPSGWLFDGGQTTINISGNNVHAFLDTDANNAPDSGGATVGGGNFITAQNPASDPGTDPNNRAVAVQNLFYFNNLIHDELYQHGFVEGAGNFQEDNFNNGGNGGDSVNAEAQDGSGINNANFSTPSDGGNPRMQMFLWNLNSVSPRRDGDVDSDIIWHEYGHGLTWRMIGSMSGSVSGAIGEGMSDVLAIVMNNDDAVGEYSFNNDKGIRSARYGVNTRTLGDFSGQVHRDGEIIATAYWRLWATAGLTTHDMMDLIVGAMILTPAGPTYLDMRDALLDADTGDDDCLIWQAFADTGMGVDAKMQFKGRFGNRVTITESFLLPEACGGETTPPADPPADPPAEGLHLGDLTGSSRNQGPRWRATAVLTVHDGSENPAANIAVSFEWSTNDSGSCTTDSAGRCSISLGKLTIGSVTFTVTALDSGAVTSDAGIETSINIDQP